MNFSAKSIFSRPSRVCFREGRWPYYHCPATTLLVGGGENSFRAFIIITVPSRACSRVGCNRLFHCPITSPSHLGGGEENFPSYIISRSMPCLLSSGLQPSITVQPQPTFGGGEEVIVSFHWPSLPITSAQPVDKRVLLTVRSLAPVRHDDFHRRQRRRFPGLLQHHQVQVSGQRSV